MTDWRPFDIKSFLKASRHWDDDIKRLQEEHDNLSELPSSGNIQAGTKGSISDMTGRVALRRLEITAQIEEIMLCKEMLAFALKTLSNEDKRLIDGFFYPKQSIGSFVYDYGKEQGLNKDYVYAERERVLKKMGDVILRQYYEE